jgi:light-regulated signal transduction histidine kinase (bacteriophytochrome)
MVSSLLLASGTAHSAGMNGFSTPDKGRVQQTAATSENERHLLQTLELLSYSVSHDLRSPIRHIQSYAQKLADEMKGALPDKAQAHLDNIIGASRGMGRLIDDLLAYSRMARSEMQPHPVDLNPFLEETVRALKLAAKDRNILWKTPPLPPVVGDETMLKLVLLNLVGNAVKFSGSRNPAEIEVACDGMKMKDGRMVFLVRDNGVGFDMKYHHKLFKIFERLHAPNEFGGTGTGLAMVQSIICRHGGQVWAEGQPDAGATFYFTLMAA